MEHVAGRPGTSEVNVTLAVEDAGIRLILDNDGAPPTDETRAAMESALRGRIGLVDGWVSVEPTARGGTAITAMVPQGAS
jgi:signal transduction histidine kinase